MCSFTEQLPEEAIMNRELIGVFGTMNGVHVDIDQRAMHHIETKHPQITLSLLDEALSKVQIDTDDPPQEVQLTADMYRVVGKSNIVPCDVSHDMPILLGLRPDATRPSRVVLMDQRNTCYVTFLLKLRRRNYVQDNPETISYYVHTAWLGELSFPEPSDPTFMNRDEETRRLALEYWHHYAFAMTDSIVPLFGSDINLVKAGLEELHARMKAEYQESVQQYRSAMVALTENGGCIEPLPEKYEVFMDTMTPHIFLSMHLQQFMDGLTWRELMDVMAIYNEPLATVRQKRNEAQAALRAIQGK